MTRFIHISLWLLIIYNFCAALIILCAPYSFSRWLDSVIVSLGPTELSILDKESISTMPSIRIDGPISGQSGIVKREP
jgi:hypothetical protein